MPLLERSLQGRREVCRGPDGAPMSVLHPRLRGTSRSCPLLSMPFFRLESWLYPSLVGSVSSCNLLFCIRGGFCSHVTKVHICSHLQTIVESFGNNELCKQSIDSHLDRPSSIFGCSHHIAQHFLILSHELDPILRKVILVSKLPFSRAYLWRV